MSEYNKIPVWKLCHLLASGEWKAAIEKFESHWRWSVSSGGYEPSHHAGYIQYEWCSETGKMMWRTYPEKSPWEEFDGRLDMYDTIRVKEYKGE